MSDVSGGVAQLGYASRDPTGQGGTRCPWAARDPSGDPVPFFSPASASLPASSRGSSAAQGSWRATWAPTEAVGSGRSVCLVTGLRDDSEIHGAKIAIV